jgi:UrcA family protein
MNTIRTKIYTAIFCALGTASLSVLTISVGAAEDLPQKTVRYADLNIAQPAGAQALYGRISAAAREVCDRSIGWDPIERLAMRACVDKTIDNAVKKVDEPALSALRFGGTDVLRLAKK